MFAPYLLFALAILTPFLEVHSLSHKENQRKDHHNLKKVLEGHEERMRLLRETLRNMENFEKELEWYKASVGRSLTTSVIGGVVGTVLCFTPLAPVGIGIAGASAILAPVGIGIAGASAAIGGVTVYGDKMNKFLAMTKLRELIKEIKKNSKSHEYMLKTAIQDAHFGIGISSTNDEATSVSFIDIAGAALAGIEPTMFVVNEINDLVTDALGDSLTILVQARVLAHQIKGLIKAEEKYYWDLKSDIYNM